MKNIKSNFEKISQELIEHYGLSNKANNTEMKALAYALEDCYKMYDESEVKKEDNFKSFKDYIIDYHVKGDYEADNLQDVEDIVYSLYFSMITAFFPEELDFISDDEFRIKDIKLGFDGKYHVSFLCSECYDLLEHLEDYIKEGNTLNEFTKFALRNTDNFFYFDSLDLENNKGKNMGSRTITNILITTGENTYSKSFYNQHGYDGFNILSVVDYLPNYQEFFKTLDEHEQSIIQECLNKRQLNRTDLEGSADVFLFINQDKNTINGIVTGCIYKENGCFNTNNSPINASEINQYSTLSYDFSEQRVEEKYVLSFEEYINRIKHNYKELDTIKTIIKKMSEYYQIESFNSNINIESLYNTCHFYNKNQEVGVFLESFLKKYGCLTDGKYFHYLKNTFSKHISMIKEIGFGEFEILLDDFIVSDRVYCNSDDEFIQNVANNFFSVILSETNKEIFGSYLSDFYIERMYVQNDQFNIDIYHNQSKEQLEDGVGRSLDALKQCDLFTLLNLSK
ncbi:TPA: hypothetical protein R1707_001208 [Campylobacter lari]|nr:hypothetical protein [Campylobacter lari]